VDDGGNIYYNVLKLNITNDPNTNALAYLDR